MRRHKEEIWQRCRKDAVAAMLLAALSLFFCWFFIGRFGIFGSKVDWISQHSVIPDYFRQQFYETGELFPEFALNLGGGQNIYNFSYYGLYSPVILLSYLFPSVSMGDYIMVSSICLAALSAVLFYLWLRSRGFTCTLSFWSALMLELSGPVIFHSSRHVMFVNYMPFLILSLWGIDRYFGNTPEVLSDDLAGRKNRSKREHRRLHQTFYGSPWLYIGSVFLMILTSFYFSVGGLLVLCIYGLHRYAQVSSRYRMSFRQFGKDAVAFLLPLVTAVCMSAFLLVPTAYALAGKREAAQAPSLAALLTPDFYDFRLFYNSYGIGLTAFAAAALLAGCCWKKAENRILIWSCIAVLLLPVFPWILNGGLYPRDKALIPFLPLLCYVTAIYAKRLQEGRRDGGAVPYILVDVLLIWGSGYQASDWMDSLKTLFPALLEGGMISFRQQRVLLLFDAFLMLLFYLIFRWRRNIRYLVIPPVLFLMLFGISFHGVGNIESEAFYDQVTDERTGEAMEEVLNQEKGFYRMEQCGTYAENMANVDRIWDMDQYSSSIYASSYHDGYQSFCQETFGLEQPTRNALIQQVSQNPSFRRLMGVKYIVMNDREENAQKRQKAQLLASGYELCCEKDGVQIYQNGDVAPIGYVTDRVITQDVYEALPFPYNQIALEYFAVAGTSSGKKKTADPQAEAETIKAQLSECVREISVFFPEENGSIIPAGGGKTGTYSKNAYSKVLYNEEETAGESEKSRNNGENGKRKNIHSENAESKVEYYQADSLYVNTKKARTIQVPTDGTDAFEQPWVLYLQFTVKNAHPSSDLTISVEGVQNKLSASTHLYKNENTVFTYAVPMQAGQGEIEMTFGQGEYDLMDVTCFAKQETGQEAERSGAETEDRPYGDGKQTGWMPDDRQTKGNVITGTVCAKETSWFVTSIPYDEHFEVLIDGIHTVPGLVNMTFLGFRIPGGEHTVTFIYHAPGLTEGKTLALLGIVLCAMQLAAEWKKRRAVLCRQRRSKEY